MSNTPFPSKRAAYYADIPDEKWNNWRWQLSNRINTVEEFEQGAPPHRQREAKPSPRRACSASISPPISSR